MPHFGGSVEGFCKASSIMYVALNCCPPASRKLHLGHPSWRSESPSHLHGCALRDVPEVYLIVIDEAVSFNHFNHYFQSNSHSEINRPTNVLQDNFRCSSRILPRREVPNVSCPKMLT